MTVQIHDPAMPHLTDEKAFSIQNEDGDGVNIHPWIRPNDDTFDREVSIIVGTLPSNNSDEDQDDDFRITIVDRAEFIDGLLEVFPELARAATY